MRAAVPPLPQYAFMAWCSAKKSTVSNALITNELQSRALLEKLIVTYLV
jgi:hypothetical protein